MHKLYRKITDVTKQTIEPMPIVFPVQYGKIYAEIEKIDVFENKSVAVGDTLVWLRTDELDEQIRRLEEKQDENRSFITDLDNLLSGFHSTIFTPKYKSELSQYKAKEERHRLHTNNGKYR